MRSGLKRLTRAASAAAQPVRHPTHRGPGLALVVRRPHDLAGERLDVLVARQPANERWRQEGQRIALDVQATPIPTVAGPAPGLHRDVTDLEGVPGAAGEEVAVRDQRTADAPTSRGHEEHDRRPGTCAVAMFGQRGQVGVVADVDGESGTRLAD